MKNPGAIILALLIVNLLIFLILLLNKSNNPRENERNIIQDKSVFISKVKNTESKTTNHPPPPKTTNHPPSKREYKYTKENYVIMTIDDNIPYTFFAPLLSLLWPKMGYTPIFITYTNQTSTDHHLKFILDSTNKFGGKVVHAPLYDPKQFVKGVPEMTSRYFSAFLDFDPESYIILSDIDMIPIKKEFYDQADNVKNKVTLWNSFAIGPAHGTCYVGAKVSTWREVMAVGNGFDINTSVDEEGLTKLVIKQMLLEKVHEQQADRQWAYDQEMYARKLSVWSKNYNASLVKRVPRVGPVRLDRSPLNSFLSVNENSIGLYSESHCARPIHHTSFENVWKVMSVIYRHVSKGDPETVAKADSWFKEFQDLPKYSGSKYSQVWS